MRLQVGYDKALLNLVNYMKVLLSNQNNFSGVFKRFQDCLETCWYSSRVSNQELIGAWDARWIFINEIINKSAHYEGNLLEITQHSAPRKRFDWTRAIPWLLISSPAALGLLTLSITLLYRCSNHFFTPIPTSVPSKPDSVVQRGSHVMTITGPMCCWVV